MESADIFLGRERAGTVEIGYLDVAGDPAALAEERVLLDLAAGIIGITLERKAAERQLKETLERLEKRERERGS